MTVTQTMPAEDWHPGQVYDTKIDKTYSNAVARLPRNTGSFATEPDIDNKTIESSAIAHPNNEIIKSVEGTVLRISGETVRVAIKESVIHFPKALFQDRSLIRFGQPVYYQIKKSSNGVRYQTFEKREASLKNDAEKDELLEILECIPYPEQT
ncbi:MAG: hypothetical protein HQM12_10485 [SAR324 cluster bacterium]|nr:hypothetical protein [SAR324 cluster bacterium]